MDRTLFASEHALFRDTVRAFFAKEVKPHADAWEEAGIVDKAMFRAAGDQGLLGMAVPEQYGGGGERDFRYNMIIGEESARADTLASGLCITLHNDVCLPYFLDLTTEEQKERWLPGMVTGDLMTAVAMTEPGAGSDLAGIATTAMADGDHYVVNGSKTFITNGINSDVIIVAVKTDPDARHAGMSLVVVEEGMEGFERGRNLSKIGMHAQDTAELFFNDVMVPASNILGEEGRGFLYLVSNLPQERISLAAGSLAHAETAFAWTLEYVTERTAFGTPIGSFQAVKHRMAEMATELEIARVYIDRQVEALNVGALTAEDAAKAKWWTTELEKKVIDSCLQFFGGWGYMEEYPIARAFRDARVQTIYGGTTEIMKEIVGRSLGL